MGNANAPQESPDQPEESRSLDPEHKHAGRPQTVRHSDISDVGRLNSDLQSLAYGEMKREPWALAIRQAMGDELLRTLAQVSAEAMQAEMTKTGQFANKLLLGLREQKTAPVLETPGLGPVKLPELQFNTTWASNRSASRWARRKIYLVLDMSFEFREGAVPHWDCRLSVRVTGDVDIPLEEDEEREHEVARFDKREEFNLDDEWEEDDAETFKDYLNVDERRALWVEALREDPFLGDLMRAYGRFVDAMQDTRLPEEPIKIFFERLNRYANRDAMLSLHLSGLLPRDTSREGLTRAVLGDRLRDEPDVRGLGRGVGDLFHWTGSLYHGPDGAPGVQVMTNSSRPRATQMRAYIAKVNKRHLARTRRKTRSTSKVTTTTTSTR